MEIRALINSCWGANLGAPQVPIKYKNVNNKDNSDYFYRDVLRRIDRLILDVIPII